ncbi:MAG: sigma-54 dependent transcriptional regulator [Bacteroidota bacterium]
MKSNPLILIIEDDTAVCASLQLLLKRKGYQVELAFDPTEALLCLDRFRPDLILLDMNFSVETTGDQGLDTLHRIQLKDASIPVILMTGWGSLELAVSGMKAGAKDFLTKPWNNAALLQAVATQLQLERSPKEAPSTNKAFTGSAIIGQNPALLEVLQLAERVSPTDASVLILGESGTGKELLAEAIHEASERAREAFVKVNLGGISSSLFESEMFGHKKGAFTGAVADRKGRFEVADRGTIFLDEIGELALASQVKLLRVLQEKTFEVLGSSKAQKVDVRVISATNKDLKQMVQQGEFREDLFYRLNLITLRLPSLRERASDIPLLVAHFVDNLKQLYRRPALEVSAEAMHWLQSQAFPGNIRQLRNLVERTVLVSLEEVLEVHHFARHYEKDNTQPDTINLPEVGEITLEEMERRMILQAMAHHNNRVSLAAQSLGLTRSALYRRLAKFDIPYDA